MYYKQINGIRAFAVLGPLVVHLWPRNLPDSPYTTAIAHLGSLGVDLFFVISGFLITGILIRSRGYVKNKRISLGRSLAIFYARRAIRIFPIYYLLITTLLLLGLKELQEHAGWYYGYMANFRIMSMGYWPGAVAHMWSLSVEEQFYLAWPLFVLLTPDRWARQLFLVLFASGPIYRVSMILLGGNSIWVGIAPISCLDPLTGGALLALWMHQYQDGRYYGKLRMIGLIGCFLFLLQVLIYVIVYKGGPINSQLPFMRTAATLVFMWLIGAAALERTQGLGAIFLFKPIEYIGRISYGIYLYHLTIPWILATVLGIHPSRSMGSFLAISAMTIVVASFSWHFIEAPINKLKRFVPSP
ncbi:MAG: acyltransferase [Flavobacteriales bacterium]|nr:acyltransferase [Flavobacteriales bacterium]